MTPTRTAARLEANSRPPMPIPLPMGGGAIGVNNRYLTRDGRPWLPVSGEFHYSRYPRRRWRRALLTMRAGGITAAASYVIWIHHEQVRGQRHFDGNLDVRHFAELCAEAGLDLVVRIGPWVHAETRNGGLPDWVLAADCTPRTDDPAYLALVTDWYGAIAEQLAGLDHASGGPIIAIQIENELSDRPEHLRTLKHLAIQAGLRAPLWTATGWGKAQLPGDELLPLFGNYTDASWSDSTEDWPDSGRRGFFYSHVRDEESIGADLRKVTLESSGVDIDRYPAGTCELGGGMAAAYHRRPYVAAEDVAAQALTKLGGGSNWQGYYMFHGGTNPVGATSTQESHATGYPNDMPMLTYDFQAPLGEFGQYRSSYDLLRLQHLMIEDFGELLAPMPMTQPDKLPEGLRDRSTLRWALRTDGDSGLLFVTNYQPHEPLPDHIGVQFVLDLPTRMVTVPSRPIAVPGGAYFCWPLGLEIKTLRLAWATAQPVCRFERAGRPMLVLAATEGIGVELALDTATVAAVRLPSGSQQVLGERILVNDLRPGTGCVVSVRTTAGDEIELLILDPATARTLYRGRAWGEQRLVLSNDGVVFDGDAIRLHTRTGGTAGTSLAVLPAPALPPEAFGADLLSEPDGVFTRYTLTSPDPQTAALTATMVSGPGVAPPVRADVTGWGGFIRASAPTDEAYQQAAVYHVEVPTALLDAPGDVLLHVDWVGDVARAYVGEHLVADQFYLGRRWTIGLSDLGPQLAEHGLTLQLLPLRSDSPIYLSPEHRPRFGDAEQLVQLHGVTSVVVKTWELRSGSDRT